MKIKAVKKMPGRWTITGIKKDEHYKLKTGNIVNVNNDIADYLINKGFCIEVVDFTIVDDVVLKGGETNGIGDT